MFSIFELIANFFEFVYSLVVSPLLQLLYFVNIMTGVLTQLPFMLDFLPVTVVSIVSGSIALAVIAKILGRDG